MEEGRCTVRGLFAPRLSELQAVRQTDRVREGRKEGRKGHIMQNERTSGKKFSGRAGRASPRLHNRILAFSTHRRTLQLASERARGTHTASKRPVYHVENADQQISENKIIDVSKVIDQNRIAKSAHCSLELRDAVRRTACKGAAGSEFGPGHH